MAENTGVHIVEIRAGDSQRPVLELRPGVVVQPMSVGRVGMWSVDAPGVLDVHAYVYFDGRALFVQSADANNPAKGNGQAIGTAWQQLEIPCTIEIGRARLVYRTLEEDDGLGDEDKTVAQPLPALPQRPPPQQQQFTPNAGAFSNRNRGPDSDATRLQPMAREPDPTIVSPLEAGTPMAGVPKARPAAGMPAWSTNDGAPVSQPTTIGAPPQAPAPPPPQNTGYQAFGSVQVAVPAPPPAPTPMGGVPVQRQAMGNPMGQTLQAPMQSPMQPMMQQQQGMQPMMQQPMMQQGMQPMMLGMQPTMQGYGPGMQPMPQGMQPGMPYAQGSGPLPQMMLPNAETGRIQPPPEELKGFKKAVAEWKAMPPLRKFIVGTFPGVALLVYFMLFDDKPQPRRIPQPPPSGSVAATASAPSAGPSVSAAPSATGSVAVMPTASSSVGVMPTASVAPSASSAPIPTASAKPPTAPKGKHSIEREAIELVGQGQYTKAADLYDQLAQQHPEQPAYKEAARLLRLRATGN